MDPDETRRPGPGLSPPRSRWHRARSAWLRAATVLALALGLGLVSPVLTPGAAHAADDWIVGGTKYSTILNCPSVVQGFPYSEPGIAATSGYFGTPGTSPTVGQTTYYAMQAVRLGSHCSTPLISPRFVLPSGVAFDKTQPINCLYTPPGPGQTIQVTNAQECPQWSNVAADGTYSSAKSGWSSVIGSPCSSRCPAPAAARCPRWLPTQTTDGTR
mgnify:CR=1 FL=1